MMKLELEIHPVQASMLAALLFEPQVNFSRLNKTDIPTDNFSFHVRRLLDLGLIEKHQNKYQLTALGKEFANRLDTDTNKIEKLAKPSVLVVVIKNKKYLIQQRLKQPYYGYYGCLTGKIRWGESVIQAAARELEEEAGLQADLTAVGVWHKIDTTLEGKLLEDKFFYIVRADNPTGEVKESFDGGKNHWMSASKFHLIKDKFRDAEKPLRIAKENHFSFQEAVYRYDDKEY